MSGYTEKDNTISLFGVKKGIICQQCNCRGAYGAGLSGAISKEFPEVFQAFIDFTKSFKTPDELLGNYQIVILSNNLAVANLFTQRDCGNSRTTGIKYTDTDKLVACIKEIAERYPQLPIYLPHSVDRYGNHTGIGCGLAGEKWEVLEDRLSSLKLPNLCLLDTFSCATATLNHSSTKTRSEAER